MAEKKYYWLKLGDEFFGDKTIKKLRKIAGGDTYTIIYLKMLLLAIKQGNRLYFEGIEDTFPAELALELDEDVENVAVTCSFLEKKGLLKVMSEEEFVLTQCDEMVGSETDAARRKRKQRNLERLAAGKMPALQEPQPDDQDQSSRKAIKDYTPEFEKCWAAYPRKIDKSGAYKKYKARINDGFSEEELYMATVKYADQCRRDRTEEKYIKHGKTFFGESTPFIDYIPKKKEPAQNNDEENPYSDWS